jgi:hypothetical protein
MRACASGVGRVHAGFGCDMHRLCSRDVLLRWRQSILILPVFSAPCINGYMNRAYSALLKQALSNAPGPFALLGLMARLVRMENHFEKFKCGLALHLMRLASGVCRSKGSIRDELLSLCSRNVLGCRQADMRGLWKHACLRVQMHAYPPTPPIASAPLPHVWPASILCYVTYPKTYVAT